MGKAPGSYGGTTIRKTRVQLPTTTATLHGCGDCVKKPPFLLSPRWTVMIFLDTSKCRWEWLRRMVVGYLSIYCIFFKKLLSIMDGILRNHIDVRCASRPVPWLLTPSYSMLQRLVHVLKSENTIPWRWHSGVPVGLRGRSGRPVGTSITRGEEKKVVHKRKSIIFCFVDLSFSLVRFPRFHQNSTHTPHHDDNV